ncbi:MAG TPA: hypothetical protein VF349_01205, partial [Candidatus Limnocylindrales bacterium]
ARLRWARRTKAMVLVAFVMAWLVTFPAVIRQVAAASDPVVAAAGDIACDPNDSHFNNGSGSGSG